MSTRETSNLSEEIKIDDEFILIRFQNDTAENLTYKRQVKTGLIQFHFGLKGKAKFIFNQGNYTLDLMEEKSLLFYNPEKELPLDVILEPKSWVISILISIKKFHGLFTADADHIPFLSEQNKDRKYYGEENITPSMAIVLNQMFHYSLNPSIKNLYYKGKGYELLSLFFNKNEDPNAEQCPFLIDEENVQRIKKAKEIIIANMAEPPGLEELAHQVGLNLKKLKAGFKQIYGDTVYGFLFDYKMEYARNLLDSGSYNVNEVGLKIGYSTASHFIAAFKKKYNTTPKKYLLEKSL
ncbi:AraC family transcriptional regulator [Flavobacterium amniphilum]|uniref:AraC family transcriptional regulator n=1 Tax=Flavobacterium amniphilum TaxID=1834035 RepID=UPI00202A1C2A|nr:AraC family transcriptional regulator [Flavobacterium amniphilum]MCL9804030.1 AraC family transcriptional regulator [Flavobacterium amniphilum]